MSGGLRRAAPGTQNVPTVGATIIVVLLVDRFSAAVRRRLAY